MDKTIQTDGQEIEQEQAGATPEAVSEERLGENGMKALEAERAAAKAAQKRVNELETLLKQRDDASKSETEKLNDRVAALESDIKAERSAKVRLEAAMKTGVPPELLDGPGDDPEAYAVKLAEWKSQQDAPTGDGTKKSESVPSVKERPEHSGAMSIDDQIVIAAQAGDTALVRMLKAMKLGKQ
ncbi:MAG: hypothetical protein PUK59_04585 [Actinomycetaceae bacterium]|nr:hypothetical protein [Actinomycetaceae bacterium]MDY5273649.1 hypothetical protein [Arcanobacterium sp.]